jgi:hypothetical protein
LNLEAKPALTDRKNVICKDLKEVYRRWRESPATDMRVLREKMLADVRKLKKTFLEAWRYSLKPKETTSQKQVSLPGARQGEGEAAGVIERERKEAGLVSEDSWGHVAFLNGYLNCIAREAKLRGLDAPQKAEISGRSGKPIEFVEVVRTVLVGGKPADETASSVPDPDAADPPKPKTTPPGPPMPGGLQFE